MFKNQQLGQIKYIKVVQGQNKYLIEDFDNLSGCYVFATKDKTDALMDEISSDHYTFESFENNNYIRFESGFPINDYYSFKIVKPEQIISIPYDFNTVSSITPDALNSNFEILKENLKKLQNSYNTQIVKIDSDIARVMLPTLDDGEVWIKDGIGYKGLKVTDFRDLAGETIIEYIRVEKENINQINKHAVQSITQTQSNAIDAFNKQVKVASDTIEKITEDLSSTSVTLKQDINNLSSSTLESIRSAGREERKSIRVLSDTVINQITDVSDVVLSESSVLNSRIIEGKIIIDRISNEIDELDTCGNRDINTGRHIGYWFGTQDEYDNIHLKEPEVNYNVYSSNGLTSNYFFRGVSPKHYFDNRISLALQGTRRGLEFWNDSTDKMSIKTFIGKSIEECVYEETDDYIIYCDRTTTVMNAMPNLYTRFLEWEEENTVEISENVARTLTGIEKDYKKILYDLNCELIEEELNKPTLYNMTLEEEEKPTFTWDMLTDEVMPTPEHFACRVDKKTGEIYVGEGYENLGSDVTSCSGSWIIWQSFENGEISIMSKPNTDIIGRIVNTKTSVGEGFIYSYKYSAEGYHIVRLLDGSNFTDINYNNEYRIVTATISPERNVSEDTNSCLAYTDIRDTETLIKIKDIQITKTSTTKPFVRKFMPNGKLSVITNATSETHSFVMKNIRHDHIKGSQFYTNNWHLHVGAGDNGALLSGNQKTIDSTIGNTDIVYVDIAKSKTAKINCFDYKFSPACGGHSGILISPLIFPYSDERNVVSFKQLLVYKGNLTEEELRTENEKFLLAYINNKGV